MVRAFFSSLCILAAAAELLVMAALINHKPKLFHNKLLYLCLALSTVTGVSYTAAINSYSYLAASLCFSIYFCSIDVILVAFIELMVQLTNMQMNRFQKITLVTNKIYAAFDILILLINPFYELAIHYELVLSPDAFWEFHPGLLYTLHLIFCYLVILEVFWCIADKLFRTPRLYWGRYSLIAEGLIVIVALNCVFLYVPGMKVFKYDVSVVLYGALCILIYYNEVYYSEKKLLEQAPQGILRNMRQPVILFDYEQQFAFRNAAAMKILPDQRPELTLQEFIRRYEFADKLEGQVMHTSFLWKYEQKMYRCDYQMLQQKGKPIGYVFTFTEASTEYDLLTGFHTEVAAELQYEQRKQSMKLPVGVMVCDLNRLSQINDRYGRDAGDQAISIASSVMRQKCPEGTHFVRMHDAILVAVCEDVNAEQMKHVEAEVIHAVSEQSVCGERLQLQCAVAACTLSQPDVRKAVASASYGISVQKMMDPGSSHSSLLFSLACALKEADPGTELHVLRTRAMGERLAARLGLSDEETAELSLLCLLHDIGKLCIPVEILNKPGKLSDQEWALLKSHTDKGYRIAKASRELQPIADAILHHHEYWDGTGYPGGLAGEEIPQLSRMIAIIDSYDAMTHDRPYRKAIGVHNAILELEHCAGKQFDPYIVTAFIKMIRESTDDLQERPVESGKAAETVNEWTDRQTEETQTVPEGRLAPIHFSRYILNFPDDIILSADTDFERLTGYTQDDIHTGKLLQSMLIFPEDLAEYNATKLRLMKKDREAFMEHRLRMKDGTCRYVFCHGFPFYDSAAQEQKIEIIIVDIAESMTVKKLLDEEHQTAEHNLEMWKRSIRLDSLTGILNRIAFRNELQTALFHDDKLWVMVMCDIDFFKQYNDSHGHLDGDQLLKSFAQILQRNVGQQGMACRMGGDEFAAALCFGKFAGPAIVRDSIEEFYHTVDLELQQCGQNVSVSMGMSFSRGKSKDAAQLYDEADQALYDAKARGKHQLAAYEDESSQ